jgi:threonine aldolase
MAFIKDGKRIVDLRSDTVTQPTLEMREAMFNAEVGDDVFGDDPTVNRLEAMAAERMGKEAALFVASGTMGNLVALLTHCQRGHEAILGDQSHTFLNEAGGAAALGGIHPRMVKNQPDGTLLLPDIQAAIRDENVHHPRTRLVCLENTHNYCFGTPLRAEYTQAVGELAHSHGLKLHIDGARIFNAAVALRVDVKELTAPADSIQFCLSKGLGAPVGSLLCGARAFIYEARRNRKMVGGGMRQAGVLAAAGIVSLTKMVDRLAQDHANARRLMQGIAEIPGLVVEPVHTNLVFFRFAPQVKMSEAEFVQALEQRDVRLLSLGPRCFRVVTHCWIDADDIESALDAMREVMGDAKSLTD